MCGVVVGVVEERERKRERVRSFLKREGGKRGLYVCWGKMKWGVRVRV